MTIFLDLIKKDEEGAMRMIFNNHRDLKASMLQDLEKGLPYEMETLSSYVSRKSAKADVHTPVNDKATEII